MNFFKCGVIGLIMEVFWTGTTSLVTHDKKLTGTTSLLMFPIYGMAAFIKPLYKFVGKANVFVRGTLYASLIYLTEFSTGMLLKKRGRCPWDYSNCRYNIKGIIRLDYAPLWFIVGLFYEKVLMKKNL